MAHSPGRPPVPADKKRDRLSTTIAPESMRRIAVAAAKRGITLGAVIDDLVKLAAEETTYFKSGPRKTPDD